MFSFCLWNAVLLIYYMNVWHILSCILITFYIVSAFPEFNLNVDVWLSRYIKNLLILFFFLLFFLFWTYQRRLMYSIYNLGISLSVKEWDGPICTLFSTCISFNITSVQWKQIVCTRCHIRIPCECYKTYVPVALGYTCKTGQQTCHLYNGILVIFLTMNSDLDFELLASSTVVHNSDSLSYILNPCHM